MKKIKTTIPSTSIFYKVVTILNFTGYIFLSFMFYCGFFLLNWTGIQSGRRVFFTLFFACLILLPYIFIFRKIKNPRITSVSNLSIFLYFWFYPQPKFCELCGLWIFVLPPVLIIHNLFMSIGHYLMQPSPQNRESSKKKCSFGKVLIFLLLTLPTLYYLFYSLSR